MGNVVLGGLAWGEGEVLEDLPVMGLVSALALPGGNLCCIIVDKLPLLTCTTLTAIVLVLATVIQ